MWLAQSTCISQRWSFFTHLLVLVCNPYVCTGYVSSKFFFSFSFFHLIKNGLGNPSSSSSSSSPSAAAAVAVAVGGSEPC